MKPLADSKTRLSGHLSGHERAELSAVMLASVLAALQGFRGIDDDSGWRRLESSLDCH